MALTMIHYVPSSTKTEQCAFSAPTEPIMTQSDKPANKSAIFVQHGVYEMVSVLHVTRVMVTPNKTVRPLTDNAQFIMVPWYLQIRTVNASVNEVNVMNASQAFMLISR
jgi:hypothetical protein